MRVSPGEPTARVGAGRGRRVLTPAVTNVMLALVGGTLTYVVTTGGLFVMSPWIQSAVVSGIVVGLLARGPLTAGLVGAFAGAAGMILGPQNIYNYLFLFAPHWPEPEVKLIAATAAVCAASSVVAALMGRFGRKAKAALIGAALMVVLAGLWFTPLSMNMASSSYFGDWPLPPFNQALDSGSLVSVYRDADSAIFFNAYEGMRGGKGFYSQYAQALESARGTGSRVTDFREPALFWLWSMLPSGRSV